MTTDKRVEEIVIKLTRIAHPEDLGEPTSKLENAIREALTQHHQDVMREVVEGFECGCTHCHERAGLVVSKFIRESLTPSPQSDVR